MRRAIGLVTAIAAALTGGAAEMQTYSESRTEYDRLISRKEAARLMAELLEADKLPYPPHHIKVDYWDFLDALPPVDFPHPPIDPYGGVAPLPEDAELIGTPGYFRTAKAGGVWWFVTPDDNLFLSIAVTDVTHRGHSLDGRNRYARAVEEKFEDEAAWADHTLERIRGWGFNTLGPWSSFELFEGRMPYTVIIDVAPHMGYADAAGRVPDYWAEDFEEKAEAHIARVTAPYRDDPWMMGFFTDNEVVWGPDWRTEYTLLQIYLDMPADSPGRAEALRFLREHAEDLDDFNAVWGLDLADWAALEDLLPGDLKFENARAEAVGDGFATHALRRYASVCRKHIEKHAPNHLILGCRFHDYLSDAIMIEAARHFDVVSLAYYWMMPPIERMRRVADAMDRPLLIEEFSFRGMDADLPNENFAGPNVASQYDRAIAYHNYVTAFMREPYAVSVHWYKYFDNPPGLLRTQGENYGLVNADDEPYEIFVRMVEAVNSRLYALRLPPE